MMLVESSPAMIMRMHRFALMQRTMDGNKSRIIT